MLRKLLVFIPLFLFLVILVAVLSLRFFPKLYLLGFNKLSSDQQLSAQAIDVEYFPLSLSVDQLGVHNIDGSTLLTLDKAKLSAQLIGWLKNKNNFWAADLSNADVRLNNLATSKSVDSSSSAEPTKVNVHQILSALNLNVDNLLLKIDDKQSVKIDRFSTSLNDTNLTNFSLVEQDIEFSLVYNNMDVNPSVGLFLDGTIASRYKDGVSIVDIIVPELDLSVFNPSIDDAETNSVSSEKIENKVEELIDWSWIDSIDPVTVNVQVNQTTWSKSSFDNNKVHIDIAQGVEFELASDISWLESDEFSFKDKVALTGNWQAKSQQTQGADLEGALSLVTSLASLKINGDVNVNGLEGNKLSSQIELQNLPLDIELNSDVKLLIEQYFPIKAVLDVEQINGISKLMIQQANLGESDLSGAIEIAFNEILDIKAQLESNLLSHYSLESDNKEKSERALEPLPEIVEGEETEVSAESQQASNDKVFSDEPIDWSWLDALNLSLDWRAKQVVYDDIEMSNLYLPVNIADSKMGMSDFSVELGEGEVLSTSSLTKQGESADIVIILNASDVVLEKLKLLPAEELKKAVTNLSVELKASGQSSKQLTQTLDGKIKLNVGEGIIGNDSFELVGSDLLLSLLNKLNPFANKDKTTELECAVVNLDIDKGKINVDKSIALKSSKLTMVADGYIDLPTEKIKLNMTPKARQGIGVDVSSLVKFIALGGTLTKPSPTVTASGVLKSAVVVGAAVSTGGVSLLATSAAEKTVANVDVCKRADKAF